MPEVLIKPTIGRRIWFWPGQLDLYAARPMRQVSPEQPFDAGVVYVHSDTCVNLQVTDHMGGIWFREKVRILQEGDDHDEHEFLGVAQWMHYQAGQAAREAERASEKAVSPPEDTATHQTSLSETAWREANIPKASNWPSSTPKLNASRLGTNPSRDMSYSWILVARPNPWQRPKMKVAARGFGWKPNQRWNAPMLSNAL